MIQRLLTEKEFKELPRFRSPEAGELWRRYDGDYKKYVAGRGRYVGDSLIKPIGNEADPPKRSVLETMSLPQLQKALAPAKSSLEAERFGACAAGRARPACDFACSPWGSCG